MRPRRKINYTIYSSDYVTGGAGEFWDFPTLGSAKRKAQSFGPGSLVIRNFETALRNGDFDDWWQAERCWLWDGRSFARVLPVAEKKWLVARKVWWPAASLTRFRGPKR